MTLVYYPESKFGIALPGYENCRYAKIYRHPRRRHPFDDALNRAREHKLVLPSLDEVIALRVVAGETYNAHLPHVTRTALWQWRQGDETYLMFEHNASETNTVMNYEGRVPWSGLVRVIQRSEANAAIQVVKNAEDPRAFVRPYDEKDIPLDQLEEDKFLRYALRNALAPFKEYLYKQGHSSLHVKLPTKLNNKDINVHIFALVLGQGRQLFFERPDGFAVGVVPNGHPTQPKSL